MDDTGDDVTVPCFPNTTGRGPSAIEFARYLHDTMEKLRPKYYQDIVHAEPIPWDMVPVRERALKIAMADSMLKWLRIGRQ